MNVWVVPVQGYYVRPLDWGYFRKMIFLKHHSLLRMDENRSKERSEIHECWVPVWLVLQVTLKLSVFGVLVGEVMINATLDKGWERCYRVR